MEHAVLEKQPVEHYEKNEYDLRDNHPDNKNNIYLKQKILRTEEIERDEDAVPAPAQLLKQLIFSEKSPVKTSS